MAVSLIQVASADVAFRRSCEFCGLTFTKQPALRISGMRAATGDEVATVYIHRHCAAMVLETVFTARDTRAVRAKEAMAQTAALSGRKVSEFETRNHQFHVKHGGFDKACPLCTEVDHERHIATGKWEPASCHDCAMLQEENGSGPSADDWSGSI